jgi:uncharacterized protein YkwD
LRCCGAAARHRREGGQSPAESCTQAALHTAINGLRAEQGLVHQRDAALDTVARAHSEDMATRHYLAQRRKPHPPAHERAGVATTRGGENVSTTTRSTRSRDRQRLDGVTRAP